jgi:uncharacterized protein (DUF58 family)
MTAAPRRNDLRWRPRTYLFLAFGAGLLVAAVALRNPVPLFLGLGLLVAPAAAALAGPRRDPDVGVEWGETGATADVRISGRITAPPGISAEDLVLSITRPASLQDRAPPETKWIANVVDFRREWAATEPTIAVVPPPTVVWRDPGGFVERSARGPFTDLVVVRYPPELVRLATMRLDRTTVLPGETRSRRIGAAGEFFGIRNAEPEDPPRRINWRASGRAGRLLANDFALERTGDVVLLLDARPSELGRAIDERLLSIARAAAEGIAESLLRAKARVGLGIYGEFLEAVPLSMGRAQRVRLRATLLAARLAGTAGPSERCAIAMGRFFPPGVTTILISSLADDASTTLVPHLRRRGFRLLVLSPSPVPLIARGTRLSAEEDELAMRLLRLIRRAQITRTWEDAPTVDWPEYGSLGGFVEFVRRPATRRAA